MRSQNTMLHSRAQSRHLVESALSPALRPGCVRCGRPPAATTPTSLRPRRPRWCVAPKPGNKRATIRVPRAELGQGCDSTGESPTLTLGILLGDGQCLVLPFHSSAIFRERHLYCQRIRPEPGHNFAGGITNRSLSFFCADSLADFRSSLLRRYLRPIKVPAHLSV